MPCTNSRTAHGTRPNDLLCSLTSSMSLAQGFHQHVLDPALSSRCSNQLVMVLILVFCTLQLAVQLTGTCRCVSTALSSTHPRHPCPVALSSSALHLRWPVDDSTTVLHLCNSKCLLYLLADHPTVLHLWKFHRSFAPFRLSVPLDPDVAPS